MVKGYFLCELNEESHYFTTFQTPIGRFRFKCIPIGSTFVEISSNINLMRHTVDPQGYHSNANDMILIKDHDINITYFPE